MEGGFSTAQAEIVTEMVRESREFDMSVPMTSADLAALDGKVIQLDARVAALDAKVTALKGQMSTISNRSFMTALIGIFVLHGIVVVALVNLLPGVH